MNNLADIAERNLELLASVESLDNGKGITMARGDVAGVIATIRYYAGYADKIHGKVVDTAPDRFNYVKLEPVGVCGQIIPWNFPLLMVDPNSYKVSKGLRILIKFVVVLENSACNCYWQHCYFENCRTDTFKCAGYGPVHQRGWFPSRSCEYYFRVGKGCGSRHVQPYGH